MIGLLLTSLLIMTCLSLCAAGPVLTSRPVLTPEVGMCARCISCLDESSIPPGRKKRDLEIRTFSIDSGLCPDPTSVEYSVLQQIEFMYRNVDKHSARPGNPEEPEEPESNAPCLLECRRCNMNINTGPGIHYRRKSGPFGSNRCKIAKLDKPYLDTWYSGLFSQSPEAHGLSRPGNYGRNSDGYQVIPAGRPVFFETPRTCPIQKSMKPFIVDQVDDNGVQWYGVRFKHSGRMVYQFYEEVSCNPSGASTSTCSQQNTLRTFLMTTRAPHPTHGHTYSLFYVYGNNSNLKFYNSEIGARCVQHDTGSIIDDRIGPVGPIGTPGLDGPIPRDFDLRDFRDADLHARREIP